MLCKVAAIVFQDLNSRLYLLVTFSTPLHYSSPENMKAQIYLHIPPPWKLREGLLLSSVGLGLCFLASRYRYAVSL